MKIDKTTLEAHNERVSEYRDAARQQFQCACGKVLGWKDDCGHYLRLTTSPGHPTLEMGVDWQSATFRFVLNNQNIDHLIEQLSALRTPEE